MKHALLARNTGSTELPTEFRAPYSSTPSLQPPLERAQKLKVDSTDDKEEGPEDFSRKKVGQKGPFLTGGIRLCKKWPSLMTLLKTKNDPMLRRDSPTTLQGTPALA